MKNTVTKEELNYKYHMGFKFPLTDEQVEEIESVHQYSIAGDDNITIHTENKTLPFGKDYFLWRDMKKQHLNGEGVIWSYDNISVLSGRAGYILVKDGLITGWNICRMMA